jgi:hypothetical protein
MAFRTDAAVGEAEAQFPDQPIQHYNLIARFFCVLCRLETSASICSKQVNHGSGFSSESRLTL